MPSALGPVGYGGRVNSPVDFVMLIAAVMLVVGACKGGTSRRR